MPSRNVELHAKYGPIVRIGPNHVSLSDPEALRAIYSTKSVFTKTAFYTLAQSTYEGKTLQNLFSTSDIKYHASLKRATARIYSMTALTELEPHVDVCVDLFVSRIKQIMTPNPVALDVSAWVQYFAFDVLGEVNFSRRLGFLETGSDVDGMIHVADEMLRYVSLVGQMPSLDKLLLGNPILALVSRNSEESNQVLQFALKMIHERQQSSEKHNDILSRLLETHEASPEKLSFREIIAVTSINIIAGHDTLAINLRSVLYYLCRNPNPYRTLRDEIDEAVNAGKINSKPVTYAEAISLPYLSAVVSESMRIHPTTGFILERHVPEGGAILCGIDLPANTIVGVNAWAIQRNKDIFGEDVDEFRPERWIESPPEQIKEMQRNLFVFGAGARGCLGRNIALMQILKLIAELFRHFDIELADPNKRWHVEGTWITKQTGMDMVFLDRRTRES
ncbi:MAG: hypothetical protein M1837_007394 [Sclerophora amabilis]|nr:MAG: hypothetical protein M1837_007394 [Sclerophora amabilis]